MNPPRQKVDDGLAIVAVAVLGLGGVAVVAGIWVLAALAFGALAAAAWWWPTRDIRGAIVLIGIGGLFIGSWSDFLLAAALMGAGAASIRFGAPELNFLPMVAALSGMRGEAIAAVAVVLALSVTPGGRTENRALRAGLVMSAVVVFVALLVAIGPHGWLVLAAAAGTVAGRFLHTGRGLRWRQDARAPAWTVAAAPAAVLLLYGSLGRLPPLSEAQILGVSWGAFSLGLLFVTPLAFPLTDSIKHLDAASLLAGSAALMFAAAAIGAEALVAAGAALWLLMGPVLSARIGMTVFARPNHWLMAAWFGLLVALLAGLRLVL